MSCQADCDRRSDSAIRDAAFTNLCSPGPYTSAQQQNRGAFQYVKEAPSIPLTGIERFKEIIGYRLLDPMKDVPVLLRYNLEKPGISFKDLNILFAEEPSAQTKPFFTTKCS